MVACIFGTTRSAFSIRSRHASLRPSCWAMVRIVSICSLDITGNELAVATHAALQVDKVVGVADGADALGDLLALPGEALVLLASGFHLLLHLLQARGRLWGTTRATLCRLVVWRCRGALAPA